MKITDVTIKKVIDKADIVDIISNHIKLEKKGADYKGLCPFHNDNNPSLSVSPEKKIYKCFSCNAAGNVIKFVQDIEHISFPEAVKKVGETVGIVIEDSNEDKNYQNNKRYYKIMQEAAKFYSVYLKNTEEGEIATKYLYDRMLTVDIINRFNIGLSSSESNLLYKELSKDFSELDLINVGLIKSGSSYYDVFRERILFPLEDLNGNIVGFSGRTYKKIKNEAKYINSAESDIFKKGSILYNYYAASNDIKRNNCVFVFEGFMDVIAAYRADVFNAVATMGTALTHEQIRAIKKLTNNVVLCFDADNAGVEATKKAIQLFNQENIYTKVILLPDEMDPDEYINKFGKDELKNYLLNNSISTFDYLYTIEKKSLVVEDLSSVEKFKNNVFKLLKLYNSNVLNQKALEMMSKDLNITINSLNLDLGKTTFNKENKITNNNEQNIVIEKKLQIERRYLLAEKTLILLAYYSKENTNRIESELNNDYVDPKNRDLLLTIFEYYKENETLDTEHFINGLDSEKLSLMTDILNMEFKFTETDITELATIVSNFKREKHAKILQSKDSPNRLKELTDCKKSTTKIKFKHNY